jgi:hypothetical protein
MVKDTVFPDDKLGWKPQSRSRIRSWKSLPRRCSSGWIRDQAEHYGKLVSNCRAVGIVPPINRKPASQ